MKQIKVGKLECAVCGKGIQRVNVVSFAKKRVKHVRRPNLHVHHLTVGGERVKIKVCTVCKRVLRLEQRASQSLSAKTAEKA